MLLFTASLGALVLAIIRGNDSGWRSAGNVSLYVLAAASGAGFVALAHHRRGRAMFDLRMFGHRTFLSSCLVTMLLATGGFPFVFLGTSYLQNVAGSSPWQAGLRFVPMTGMIFLLGGVVGELSKRVPFRALLTLAAAGFVAGLLLAELTDANWTSTVPAATALGVGIGALMPTRAALSIGAFEPHRAGVASGMSEAFQQVGFALGLAISGAVFQARVTDAFKATASGAALGTDAPDAGAAISAGAIRQVAQHLDAGARPQFLDDARTAFLTGFHQTMLVGAVIAAVALVIAATGISNRDLHESALSGGVPPEVPQP